MTTTPVSDVLARVARVNKQIPPLLLELLNEPDVEVQCARLRELGQYLASLSAEVLARAAEVDGRAVQTPERVVIDARD